MSALNLLKMYRVIARRMASQCLAVIALVITTGVAQANSLNHFIVGGEVVSANNKSPFMVSILFDYDGDGSFQHGCGGASRRQHGSGGVVRG